MKLTQRDLTSGKMSIKRNALVDAWCWAVALPGCSQEQVNRVRQQVEQLTERVLLLLAAETTPGDRAKAIGAALVSLDYARQDRLQISQEILYHHLLQQNDNFSAEMQQKVATLLGYITIGFWQQIGERPAKQAPAVPVLPSPQADIDSSNEDDSPTDSADISVEMLRRQLERHRHTDAKLRQRNQELALYNRAIQIFNSTLELEKVLTHVLNELSSLMGVLAFSAWLVDRKTQHVVCWQVSNVHSNVMQGWRLPLGTGVVGWVAENNESVIITDTRTDWRHYKVIDQKLSMETRSMLSVPLQGRHHVLGVLQVVDTQPNRFKDADKALLEFVAAIASVAIENAQLYEQTRQDAETKSMLLREINHRVRNNLTVIKSILYLKQSQINDHSNASHQTVAEEIMSYVQGLATTHNLLSNVNWGPVLLSDLVARIAHTTLRSLMPNKTISLHIQPAEVWVDADQAHDLTLLINEICTNTAKYAWQTKENQGRLVRIEITLQDETIRLRYQDNGVGYPARVLHAKQEQRHLGFELMQNIVQNSLRGNMAISNNDGAVTVVEFPVATQEPAKI